MTRSPRDPRPPARRRSPSPGSVAIVAATANGRRHAAHLRAMWADARVFDAEPSVRAAVTSAWHQASALVLCMATGAAVRLIAGLLTDKRTDPAVVAVDDAARFAVALTGGHHGANALAERVADTLGAQPVITTASDVLGLPALDTFGADSGLRIDPNTADLAAVGAALASGEPVSRTRSQPWPTGPLPGTVIDTETPAPPAIVVTDEVTDPPRPAVMYRPASLVVGVGASRGAPAAEIGAAIDAALDDAGLSPHSVVDVATIAAKAGEPGLVAAARARGWPVTTFPAATLAAVKVPSPSAVVEEAVGTPSVAEAAALARGGTLIVGKQRSHPREPGGTAMATVAVARLPVRGRVMLVSTGPGDEASVTPRAQTALAGAEVVVGLQDYVDRVRRWLRPGCQVIASPVGHESARADHAIAHARAGHTVVLLSGGDVGVYAMASPLLERLGEDPPVDVEVVPGVTAAVAAAALLGAPLGHDHCAISLSDLLTPWEVIRQRVQAAAEGDFVVCFYNPRSRARDWQLDAACRLLAEHRKPNTPVGIVRDAFRPTQSVTLTTLGDLDPRTVDMVTIVVVGSSQTTMLASRMITPRGYRLSP
jgi:cobalt-precorrin 5A hydrolase/precorrin-3B C17-methyltransferase